MNECYAPSTIRRLLTLAILLPSFSTAQTRPRPLLETVPYMGCPADGQLGPQAALVRESRQMPLPAAAAAQLAWYEYRGDAGGMGTLAPRGWNCFATIGSNGLSLYIAPEPLDATKVLEHRRWKGFTGPAVQLSESEGGTSGRFEVAEVIARVFPSHRSFVRRVIAENFRPASDFPFGPFASDRLTYRSKELVEFVTPPRHKGLGTMSWLLPSDRPIFGMALLSTQDDWGLVHLSFRLPPQQQALAPVLIRAAERQEPTQ